MHKLMLKNPYVVCSCTQYSFKYCETQTLAALDIVVIRKFCVYVLFLFTLHINFDVYGYASVLWLLGRSVISLQYNGQYLVFFRKVYINLISIALIQPKHIFDSTPTFFRSFIYVRRMKSPIKNFINFIMENKRTNFRPKSALINQTNVEHIYLVANQIISLKLNIKSHDQNTFH